jgi:metal-responsive CopG/Arc/MetJ family transcriptional regulator
MGTTTVNISFQEDLLKQIDRIAKAESRSRSEFIREAARSYLQRKQRLADLFAFGQEIAQSNKITQQDVAEEIKAYRKDNTPNN